MTVVSEEKKKAAFLFPMEEYQANKPPVPTSACFLGFPCRWHGRTPKRREELIRNLEKKYTLAPYA